MSEFKREERYIVVKLSDLTKEHQKDLRRYLAVKDMRTREAVVVEPDWPIYEETWENVQRLAEGQPSIQDEMALAMFDINKARAVAEAERNALEAKWRNTGLPGRYEALNDDGHRLLGSREAVAHFRAQFSALAAHVEQIRNIKKSRVHEGHPPDPMNRDLYEAIDDAPETSLARLKAQWQASKLDELMAMIGAGATPDEVQDWLVSESDGLRRQAGGDA